MTSSNNITICYPPPATLSSNLPIIQKATEAYKLWQICLDLFPKPTKFSLGVKIDLVFVELIENLFLARYAKGETKLLYINTSGAKLDLLKFLTQIAWEMKAIDVKKFSLLANPLNEIGKMIGGWQRHINETPSQ